MLFAVALTAAPLNSEASEAGKLPDHLSGLSMANAVAYDVRFPLWSDGAEKKRWIILPSGQKAVLPSLDVNNAIWILPIGTILMKEFNFDRRVETRIMRKDSAGWEFASYKWNDDQTDADRVDQSETVRVVSNRTTGQQIDWQIPAPHDCIKCHGMAPAQRSPLGIKITQLGEQQITAWDQAGFIANTPPDLKTLQYFPDTKSSQITSTRENARAYLDVNCATCHRPQGFVPTNLDFRWETTAMNAIDARPQFGDLGISDGAIIKLNDKEKSVLWRRMTMTGPLHMPYRGASTIDAAGAAVLGAWIDNGAP